MQRSGWWTKRVRSGSKWTRQTPNPDRRGIEAPLGFFRARVDEKGRLKLPAAIAANM